MRKRFLVQVLFVVAVCLATVSANAQSVGNILKDKNAPLYFYGIDFTKAKLIGDARANTQDIVAKQFAGINELFLKEPSKYDIAAAFRRDDLPINLSVVQGRNEKVNPDQLLSSNTGDFRHVTNADVNTIVKALTTEKQEGTGIVFIADGMSKGEKAFSMWVTLFDLKTKKVLLAERLEGKLGSGFSFRNYWATGVKSVVDQIKNTNYNSWKLK